MNKRILLPADFSKNALNSVRYTPGVYAEQRCDFYFLNFYQVDGCVLNDVMMVSEPGENAFESAK